MYIEGYKQRLFEILGMRFWLKIPDFQYKAIFGHNEEIKIVLEEGQVESDILRVEPAYIAFCYQSRWLYIPNLYYKKLDHRLPCKDYIEALYDYHKFHLARLLCRQLKRKQSTIESIIRSGNSHLLLIYPLKNLIESSEYWDNYRSVKTVVFNNIPYQNYLEAMHYRAWFKVRTIDGKSIVEEKEFDPKKSTYKKYPQLLREGRFNKNYSMFFHDGLKHQLDQKRYVPKWTQYQKGDVPELNEKKGSNNARNHKEKMKLRGEKAFNSYLGTKSLQNIRLYVDYFRLEQ
ncbi:hypothetical protein [Litorilituus lipolyticus]|uniref:Uncharacterized protein n=1 Tax=Litorilituus lipolyticus TaxID=2491017 RepID=A0A502L3I2_9GAMM|nr:hypothetical protein [Litorilituus lipolyticus]TPH18498.1 hypothetical protein EPA86_01670 [Litorilituus lipolyticus]